MREGQLRPRSDITGYRNKQWRCKEGVERIAATGRQRLWETPEVVAVSYLTIRKWFGVLQRWVMWCCFADKVLCSAV